MFLRIGIERRFYRHDGAQLLSLQALANEGVRLAYGDPHNPLRATMVRDPLGGRRNTKDNTPAVLQVELVAAAQLDALVVAKGGGGDVKARFATLNPSDSVADWVINQLPAWAQAGANRAS